MPEVAVGRSLPIPKEVDGRGRLAPLRLRVEVKGG